MKGGGFSEGGEDRLGEHDWRFNTKGNILYASVMGWPDSGQVTLRTLGTNVSGLVGDVKKVTLLGNDGPLQYNRTADGLVITLPATKPCDHAWVFKVEGIDVQNSNPVLPPDANADLIKADANGTITPAGRLGHDHRWIAG